MNIEPLETRIAPATLVVNVLHDVTVADDELTLREAIIEANNNATAADTIKFDPALDGADGIIALTSQIDITETLTILGGKKITISGNDAARIFNVDNPDTVKDHPLTVNGLTFIKGKVAANYGGAIHSFEGLTVVDCNFDDNDAVRGGAVYVETTTGAVTIKSSHFSDNTAGSGAGLFAESAKAITISGSVFGGNVSSSTGGGASLEITTATGTVAVTGSTFVGNTAALGGGLAVQGTVSDPKLSKVSITGSSFLDNSASATGGGLLLRTGSFAFSGVNISGNSTGGVGGGLAADPNYGVSFLSVTKSVIAGNSTTSAEGGGGVYVGRAISSSPSLAATFSFTQIVDNTAANGVGGGLFADRMGGKLTITSSLISANTAMDAGGIVAIGVGANATPVALTANTISGNSGGLSVVTDGDISLSKNAIVGNNAIAGKEFGAILETNGKITLKSNSIMGNRGVGLILDGDSVDSSFTTSGDVIANNEGIATGGLLIRDNISGVISKNTKITGNIGKGSHGGGVSEETQGTVVLLATVAGNFNRDIIANSQTFGTFANTLPTSSPAANIIVTNLLDSGDGSLRAAIDEANGTPAADKIAFDPTLSGVILLATPIDITETLTIFGGPKIAISGNDVTRIFNVRNLNDTKDHPLTVSGLTFVDGKATGLSGGAIFSEESLMVLGCNFIGNSATIGGGAICASAVANVTIKDSHFIENDASSDGGLSASVTKKITIAGSVFERNTGTGGGGGANIFLDANASLAVTGSLFSHNNASGASANGGGLKVGPTGPGTAVKSAITASSFLNNNAGARGGGVYFESGVASLTGVNISGNTSTAGGGGLATAFSMHALTVAKSLIAGNATASTTEGGGGVYLGQGDPGFSATISATQILSNAAASGTGGGLLADGTAGKLTVTGSLVAENFARTGGGLASRGAGSTSTTVVLTGNTVAGNEAQNGGGLWLTGDGALALTKNAITANLATTDVGGARLDSKSKITLKTNSILGNHGDNGIGGLLLRGPTGASFTTSGDLIAFNEGTTGGLEIEQAIAGIIAKNVKITGNIGIGSFNGGGITQESAGTVKLLAAVLGNLNRTDPTKNETFGPFAL